MSLKVRLQCVRWFVEMRNKTLLHASEVSAYSSTIFKGISLFLKLQNLRQVFLVKVGRLPKT
jgi:hypothetical protein